MTKKPVKRRRTLRHTAYQLNEIDYKRKLSPKELEYLTQFMYEYYQADFNFDTPLHPPELYKDCRDRNNSTKWQWHNIGEDLKSQADHRARNRKGWARGRWSGNYTLDDYTQNKLETGIYEEEDDENEV